MAEARRSHRFGCSAARAVERARVSRTTERIRGDGMHVIIYPERLIEAVPGLPTTEHLHRLLGELLDPHPIATRGGPAVVWLGRAGATNPCAEHLLERHGQRSRAHGTAVVCGWDPTSGAALPLTDDLVVELTAPFQC